MISVTQSQVRPFFSSSSILRHILKTSCQHAWATEALDRHQSRQQFLTSILVSDLWFRPLFLNPLLFSQFWNSVSILVWFNPGLAPKIHLEAHDLEALGCGLARRLQ